MGLISNGGPRARHPRGLKMMRIWRRWLREPLLTVLLTIQLVILFVLPAVRAAGFPVPRIAIDAVLASFVMLACVIARSRGAVGTMIVSVALTVTGVVWRGTLPDTASAGVSAAGQVLAQMTLLWIVSGAVFGAGPITHHRILGAGVMYLGIGMIFTSVDLLLAQILPGAFTNLPADAIGLREALTYYSFGALTTGNYGDILPVHPIARSLANLESICGQLFPATLLARIVGLHAARPRGAAPSSSRGI
jgi:hypothetical protein